MHSDKVEIRMGEKEDVPDPLPSMWIENAAKILHQAWEITIDDLDVSSWDDLSIEEKNAMEGRRPF